MRFLILTQYYPPEIGAAQTRLAALSKELARSGHDVEIVTAMPHHMLGRIYEGYRKKLYVKEVLNGITIHRTWVYASNGTGAKRLLNYLSFTLTSLFGLFKAKKPDYIFIESPPLFLSISGYIAGRIRGGTIIFNVADLWPDAVYELGVLRKGIVLSAAHLLEKWTYRNVSYVNGVTSGVLERLRQKSVDPRKLRFLPNGIDVKQFAPMAPDEALVSSLKFTGKKVFTYAGTHGLAHGLESVLLAAKELSDRKDIAFLFIGGGSMKAALVNLAQRLALSNVTFLDPLPLAELPRYLSLSYAAIVSLADKDISLSVRSSKIFPALACGLPIIHCGYGEGADIVAKAGAGVVVSPEAPHQLVQAILRLISDPSSHATMSTRARELALSEFDWEHIIRTWLGTVITNPEPQIDVQQKPVAS